MTYPDIQFAGYQPIVGNALQMYRAGARDRQEDDRLALEEENRRTLEELMPQLASGAETVTLTDPKTGQRASVPAQAARIKLAQLNPTAFAALNADRDYRQKGGERKALSGLVGAWSQYDPTARDTEPDPVSGAEVGGPALRGKAWFGAQTQSALSAGADPGAVVGLVGKVAEQDKAARDATKLSHAAVGNNLVLFDNQGRPVANQSFPKDLPADQTTWAKLDKDNRVTDIQYNSPSSPGQGYVQWGVAKTLVSDATKREIESIRDQSRRDLSDARAENRAEMLRLRADLRPETVSDLGKLIRERDALPEGDPRRKAYDDAIASKNKGSTLFLNPAEQGEMEKLVDMVGEGRMNPDRVASRNPKFMTAFWSRLNEKYPEFNAVEAGANAAMARNAQLNRSVMILDSIEDVMGDFAESNRKLGLSDFPAWNKAKLIWMEQTGDPKYTEFVNWRNSLGQELANALSGAAATDMRIKMELENMQSAASPAQFKAAFDVLKKTVEARKEAFKSKPYPNALGSQPKPSIVGQPPAARKPLSAFEGR